MSGSNYPRFDRNPCNGEDFYEDAQSSVSIDTTIFTDGESRLRFSIAE